MEWFAPLVDLLGQLGSLVGVIMAAIWGATRTKEKQFREIARRQDERLDIAMRPRADRTALLERMRGRE